MIDLQTLVLNADYRPLSYNPLSLWSWKDAFTALFLDRSRPRKCSRGRRCGVSCRCRYRRCEEVMRHPDLELDLLRAFVAVAETGSFTAAADVVHRSQSAVSQKVLRLEEIDLFAEPSCLASPGAILRVIALHVRPADQNANRFATSVEARPTVLQGFA